MHGCRGTQRPKGQIFSTDLIVAVAIFMILLSFIWYYWDNLEGDMETKLEVNELQHAALGVIDSLSMTSGMPQNWTSDPANAASIGLVTTPYTISQAKLDAFMGLGNEPNGYELQKAALGTGRFDFWLALKRGGSIINSTGEPPPNSSGIYRVGVVRPVYYNDSEAVLNLVLWENYAQGVSAFNYQTL